MSDNNTNASIGFTGLLQVLLIALKLLDKITWSWWWVLSPIWIQFIILGIVLIILWIIEKY